MAFNDKVKFGFIIYLIIIIPNVLNRSLAMEYSIDLIS
jgi:hypothetical protein